MSREQDTDKSRRRFLGGAAGTVAAATLAPGVVLHQLGQAKPADQPVSSQQRWGMLIDTSKCANGCEACVNACAKENGWTPVSATTSERERAIDAQWIRKVNLRNRETGYSHSLPMMCQHCETAPCVDVCPTGASFRRADGIVLVDKHICIGCRYCMMACPYKARSFIHEPLHDQLAVAPRGKGTVESCTLCVQRIDQKGANAIPACAEACAAEGHDAFIFGDLNDSESALSQALRKHGSTKIRADLNLNQGITYRGIEG